MAKENINKFFNAVMTDKVLAEKVVKLAKEQGYEFTLEELSALGDVRPISDDDADSAAGGDNGNILGLGHRKYGDTFQGKKFFI